MPIRYLSGLSVDSTVLVVDAANDRVGIGTASPTTKLEVGNFLDAVTNKITVAARYEYEPEFNFRLGQSGTGYDWIGAVISSGDDGNYNGKILFKTANAGRDTPTTKMVIKASGAVGIGTTAPVGILHLYKAAAATRLAIDGDAGQNRLISYRTGALQRFGLYVNNTAESGSNAGSNFAIRAYSDAGTLLSTPFFINRATGNVGIGTTSPNAKLEVDGSFNVKNGDGNISHLNYGDTSINYFRGASYFDNASVYFTGGNVGIGTTAPVGSLNISKNSTVDGLSQAITISSSSVPTQRMNLGYVPGSNYSFIDTINYGINNTNQALSLQPSGGNVGIGTTAPNAQLDAFTTQGGSTIAATHGTGGTYPKASGISFGATSTSLSVSNNGGTVVFTGGAGIYANNTAASNNPTELIFWTTSGGTPASRLTIASTGAATFSSSVTATSFIKTSGTSSQFLKADGSVDSSTYLTANQTITLSGVVTGSGTTAITTAIANGAITNAMLANSSFFVGTTSIDLGRASAAQTLTGVSIDGNAATATEVSRTVTAGTEANLVSATIGDNDFFRIRTGGASNAGFVEIATADDGTEPIYVRQYTGVFATLTRTATLLDGSGNTSFPGSVTASSLIKSGGTSAQYLMADGSVSTLTNPVTGTGTTNYVPKWTSGSAIGDSAIYDNAGNIGIGTTSPVASLDNQGSSGTYRQRGLTTMVTNNLGAAGTQAKRFEIARATIDYNDWNTVGPIEVELYERYYSRGLKKKYVIYYGYVSAAGCNLVEMTGSGDNQFMVSIGSEVVISGDNRYIPIYVDVRYYSQVTAVVKTNRELTTANPPGIGGIWMNNMPTGVDISDFTPDSTVYVGNIIGGNSTFSTGNVGIGTTSPTDTLSYGRALDIQSSTGSAIYLRDSDAVSVYGLFAYDGGATNRTSIGGIGTDNYLRIISGGNEAMRITSGGNVLIGTTTDSGYKLAVTGNTTLGYGESRPVFYDSNGGNFQIKASAGGWATGYFFQGSSGTFRGGWGGFGSADTLVYLWAGDAYNSPTIVVQGAQGNVGIGTTGPLAKLEVSAGAGTPAFNNGIAIVTGNATFTTGHGGILQFQNEDVITAAIRGVRESGWGSGLALYTHNTSSGNTFGTTVVERMRITEAGNVGIGTTAPPIKLYVGTVLTGTNGNGTYASDAIAVNSSESITIGPDRRADWALDATTATSTTFQSKLNIWSDNEDHITFGGASTHLVSAWESFKIWINNDSADAGTLHLYHTSSKTEFVRLAGSGNSWINGGNVGIGTTSPTTYSLSGTHTEIFGGSTYSFLHVNTTTVKSFLASNEASLLTALFTFSAHPLTFGTNNTEKMRITSGGNVLIGTTTDAGYKLDVNGTGRFTGDLTVGVTSGLNLILEKPTGAYLSFQNGATIRGSINGNNGTDGINLNYGASHTTALAIASTGAATFSSSVTASSLIKSGGTSAQYLMADGSTSTIASANVYTQTFFVPNTGGTSQWIKLGTWTAAQGGNVVTVQIDQHEGYNASTNQNQQVYIYMKTSNGASVDANGFAADSSFWTEGLSSSIQPGDVIWESNAAGVSATTYTLYVLMGQYTNGSQYTVTTRGGTWANVETLTSPSGTTGSSTILLSENRFVVNNVLTVGGSSSGNVLIGTTADVGYKLDVSGTGRFTSNLLAQKVQVGTSATINDAAGVANTLQFANYTPSVFVTASADNYIYKNSNVFGGLAAQSLVFQTRSDTAGGGFAFVAGSTPAVVATITGAGNVGIGTTSPLSKLDVSITSSQALFVANESGTITDGDLLGAVSFGSRDGSTYSSGGITNIRSYATSTYNTGSVSGDIRFYVSSSLQNTTQAALFGTEAMRITAGGNLLIGTTTDNGYKLRVNGKGYFDNNVVITPTSESWAEGLSFVMPTTSTWGGLRWRRERVNNDGNWYIGFTALDATDDLVFGANNGGSQVDNIIRLTKAGNVGIGTTSPGAKLDVNGSIQAGSGSTFGTGSNGASIYMSSASSLGLSGNLGGYSRNLIKTDGTSVIEIGDTGTSIITAINISAGDATGVIALKTGGNNTRLYVNSSGNVGIGTTAPSAYLDVKGLSDTAGVISLQLRSGNTSGNFNSNQITLGFANTADYRHAIKSRHNSGAGAGNAIDFYIWNNSLNASDIATNPIMSIDTTNVGIGTTVPTEKLHVDGSTLITYNNSFQSTNSVNNKAILARVSPTSGIVNYAEYATATNLNGFVIGSDDARVKGNIATDSLEFITNTSTRMTILSGGNVGINTTVPGSTLHVVGDVLIQTGALGVGVNPNATDGRIDASNDIVAFSTSDRRLKENITPIANALEKVRSLTGVEFDWKEETKSVHGYEGHDVGVIAQDVQAVLPEAVRTNDSGYLSVRYEKMIALLVEAMKEQQAQIEELKKLIK